MYKSIIVDHLSYLNQLKDISFTIQKGELVAILATNKLDSTLVLNIISGLEKNTSGFVSVLGHNPFLKSSDFLKQISFLTERKYKLLEKLPPIDILEVTKGIYGLSNREFNKNLNELTQYINDPELIDKLIYKPKVVLIDDPDTELESVYEYHLKNDSTTIFATSKIDCLPNFIRRTILIDNGQIVFDGAVDEIITKFATEKIIKVKLSSVIDVKLFSEIGKVKKYIYPHVYISVPRSVVSFAAAEVIQNFPVTSLNIEELSIEEIVGNMNI